MSKGIFITAIGTDVGKTYVTGLIVKKLRDAKLNAGYYKAALSGAEEQPDGTWLPGDAAFVGKIAGIPEKLMIWFLIFTKLPFLLIWLRSAKATL